jgi:hypothetical protein
MTSYLLQQFNRLESDPDHKNSIQLRGSKGGQTNWMQITDEQQQQILAILENGDKSNAANPTKQALVERVVECIEEDILIDDYEAIDALLLQLPEPALNAYINEE